MRGMKTFFRKRNIAFLLALVMIFTLCACSGEDSHSNEAKPPYSSSDLDGEEYEAVVKLFEKNGFTNVRTEPMEDLITGWISKENSVDHVTVDGIENYSADSWYDKDVEVVIYYHSFEIETEEEKAEREEKEKADAENKAKADEAEKQLRAEEKQINALVGKNVNEAKSVISSLNYTATYLHENTLEDFTSMMGYEEESELNNWLIREVFDLDSSNKEVTFYVNHTENIERIEKEDQQRKQLEAKLDPIDAWEAAQSYGKKQYPYGFKLHYLVGRLAERPEDDNTWFLKATCTIENEYGNKYDANCEAKVTGTTDNPVVTYFVVY